MNQANFFHFFLAIFISHTLELWQHSFNHIRSNDFWLLLRDIFSHKKTCHSFTGAICYWWIKNRETKSRVDGNR